MKNRKVAALFAIFFGWLWFHKFYLGKWFQWILYLIFILTAIPFLISLLEWLLYLINNDERFDINYNFDYIHRTELLKRSKID